MNKTNSLFTQYYYIEAGSLQNNLFPIAMEYLQYLGTDKYSADDISKKFYTLACDFGVNAGMEESSVYLNGLQDNYDNGVELCEHLLSHCKPDQDALKNMIDGIKKKRSDNKLNKNLIRSGLINYAKYGARNPFNNELSNEQLDQITAEELVTILHTLTSYKHKVLYYGPANAAVISTKLSTFHKLPTTFMTVPASKPFTFTSQNSNQVLFTDYDMVQAEIQWFRNGETYSPEKSPVIKIFNEYFGGNMSGIVFQEIRESKALAYSTYAAYGTPTKKDEPFFVNAYVGCQADKMKDAVNGMQELLTNLPKSEKLFLNAQTSIKNTISTTRTTKAAILFSYLNAQKKGINYDINEKIYNATDKLTFDDIANLYTQDIAKKSYVLAIVGNDAKMNWTELNKFGPVTKLSLKDIFGY